MLRGMRSISVPGRRLNIMFSVETQGTGVKADIHPKRTGLILGMQLGYRLLMITGAEAWFWFPVPLDKPDVCITALC